MSYDQRDQLVVDMFACNIKLFALTILDYFSYYQYIN